MRYTHAIVLCIALGTGGIIYPYTILNTNFLRPYDSIVRPRYHVGCGLQVAVYGETGLSSAQGHFYRGGTSNILQIDAQTQDALAMLDGFPVDSAIGQKRIQVDATDDGIRGHFNLCGDLDFRFGGALSARYSFTPHFMISAYLPFYSARLHNVAWRDITQSITAQDIRVRTYLTQDIFSIVRQLGCLDLCGWNRTGLGDMALLAEWFGDYQQPNRQMLDNVRLNGRGGLILPTGRKSDPDRLFAFAFGHDGATGILFGGGIDVLMARILQVGVDVELLHLFGNTRERRIKVAFEQTEQLLLAKTSVYRDWGLTQRFNVYAQFYRFYRGLSLLAGYQFYKHGRDRIAFKTCAFSQEIANTSPSLHEVIIHQVQLTASFDPWYDPCFNHKVRPYVELYARLPFRAKNAVTAPMAGIVFALDF